MEPLKYFKQVVNYNKTAHENLYGAYTRFSEETEKAALGIVEKMGFAFGGNNEVFHEASAMLKKSRENYKKAIDKSFAQLDSYVKTV